MENPGPSYSAESTSQKMFIGTDKISEILNDSDSDVGSCSELLDSNMCEVNSPISNSSSIEEEEVVQPEPDRGRKRTRRAIPRRANTDFEFGWNEHDSNSSETCILWSTSRECRFLNCLNHVLSIQTQNLYLRVSEWPCMFSSCLCQVLVG
jgi:hypothetical protein